MHSREYTSRQISSTLVVPACHLVRNVIVPYARWWHGIAGATYTAIHVSGRVRGRGRLRPVWSNLKISHFQGASLIARWEEATGCKARQSKEGNKDSSY